MRARAAASLALVAVSALVLAGCSLFMQPETQVPYNPSDGINAQVGELALRNVMVITDDGELGNLVMVAVNEGDRAINATLQYETDGTKYEVKIAVPANSTRNFGFGDDGQFLIDNIGAQAGGLLELYVQYGNVPGKQLDVPVLDGSHPDYADLAPVAPLPSPTPDPTPTPSPSETAEG